MTGGTSGILVDALRRHHPFTPSFIGRAEDQAYALSVQGQPGPRLACVHAAGLVMRHDKEAYAGAAIEAAEVGKMVGDDIRILVFSAYARALADGSAAAGSAADGSAAAGSAADGSAADGSAADGSAADGPGVGGTTVANLKALMDPFTGGFISELPITTVLLRFALRIVEAYAAGQPERGRDYGTLGSGRLAETLRSIADRAGFRASIESERRQWQAFYETLDGLEVALQAGDPDALALRARARELIDGWRLAQPPGAGAALMTRSS